LSPPEFESSWSHAEAAPYQKWATETCHKKSRSEKGL